MDERLKLLRKELGMSQTAFAEKLGITTAAVGMYEVGRRSPSSGVVSLICKTFGVNEPWLRYGEGEMFNESARMVAVRAIIEEVFPDETPDYRRRMFGTVCALTDEQWQMLNDIAIELVKEQDELWPETAELINQAEAAEEPTA